MRFFQSINMLRTNEWGLNLQQAHLFAFIYELSSWADSVQHDSGELYYFASHSKILDEIPALKMKKDAIYRNINKLIEMGLVKRWVVDKNRDYYAITNKGKLWNSTVTVEEREEVIEEGGPVLEPDPPRSKNRTPLGSKTGGGPVLKPTNNNISNKYINNKPPIVPQGDVVEEGESNPTTTDPPPFDNDFCQAVLAVFNEIAGQEPNWHTQRAMRLNDTFAIQELYAIHEMNTVERWREYLEALASSKYAKSMPVVSLRFVLKEDSMINTENLVYMKMGWKGGG